MTISPGGFLVAWLCGDPYPEISKNCPTVSLSGPSDSTAIGWKIDLFPKPECLAIFSSATRSAAAPAFLAVVAAYEWATVHMASHDVRG